MKWAAGGGVWQRRLHTAVAAQDRRDKARVIVGLAAQMRCIAGRGNGCVARLMRLALKSVEQICLRGAYKLL